MRVVGKGRQLARAWCSDGQDGAVRDRLSHPDAGVPAMRGEMRAALTGLVGRANAHCKQYMHTCTAIASPCSDSYVPKAWRNKNWTVG